MKKWLPLWTGVVLLCTGCNSSQKEKEMPANEWKKEAVDTLRTVLHTQQEWVKVHAAEFLIWSGHSEGVEDIFLNELSEYGDKPQYRIGIRRVLSQVSDSEASTGYKDQILQAFLDTGGKDRIHAIETMAKLKISPLPLYPDATKEALLSDIKSLSSYTHWAVAYTNKDSAISAKKYFLGKLLNEREDILQQRIAAYILRYLCTLSPDDWNLLNKRIDGLSDTAEQKISLMTTALIVFPADSDNKEAYKNIFKQLLQFYSRKDKTTRVEIATASSFKGNDEHLPLMLNWMRHHDPLDNQAEEGDVQASAAYAVLKILERQNNTAN